MHTNFQLENPGEIHATLKVTMPLKEWIKLRDQLAKENYERPAYILRDHIDELLTQATMKFYPTLKDKEKLNGKR